MEIAVGDDVPQIVVVRADCLPQLEADWVVIQPDVVRVDPTRGWAPVPCEHALFLGTDEPTRIKLRPGDPECLCSVSSRGPDAVEVTNMSQGPLRLVAQRKRPEIPGT